MLKRVDIVVLLLISFYLILSLTLNSCMSKNISKNINESPIADFSWSPLYPKVGEQVLFNASSSYDPDGEIIEYFWSYSFGVQFPEFMGYGKFINYSWSKENVYKVTLRVTDNEGLSDTITKAVIIDGSPPEVFIEKPQPGIYILDRLIIKLPKTIVSIGFITIDVYANDNGSGIDMVEFIIDGISKKILFLPPYTYRLDEKTGLHEVKVIAYDKANYISDEQISIVMFNY